MGYFSKTGTVATTAAEAAQAAAESAQTAAEAAQAAAENVLDSFDDTYLGAKSSDPSADNDGNALSVGASYFNTATSRVRYYNGSAWQDQVANSLVQSNNLSDVASVSTARTNLGLGTAATQDSSAFATAAQADQTVSLTPGTGITTSGTYPNFTITNSAPDQTVTFSSGGATTVAGTYPNFTISSVNTTYSVGDNGLTEKNFSNLLSTKLASIEDNADVTDTSNVVSALTAGSNISIANNGTISATSPLTYSNSWVDSGYNAKLRLTPSTGSAQDITIAAGSNITLTPSSSTLTIASTDTTYSVGDGGLTENNFTTTLKQKLDGIDVSADVTNASTVASAGAVMETDFSAGNFIYADSDNTPVVKTAAQVRGILNVADGANNYVHPAHDGDDIDIDTTALTGATVISDLDLNVTTDSQGHVTDANATVATRNLTLANLGYTGETNATADQTDEEIQDIVGGMVSGNSESGITVTYDDNNGKLDFSVTSQTDENFTTADHSKLDGIESGATADQTASEIRALVESASDSNVFTDSDHSKLDGIESGATGDQTGAQIKTAYEAESDTNAFTDADHSKLDAIEANADVTDATNVNAAGAVMEADFNAGTLLYATNDDTPLPISISQLRTLLGDGKAVGSFLITGAFPLTSGSPPAGYLACTGPSAGAAYSRTTYAALYAAIGTSWGAGDGSTTFNAPLLSGLVMRGVDGGKGNDPDRGSRTAVAAGGNTGDSIGSFQSDQFKSHNHALRVYSVSGQDYSVVNNGSDGNVAVETNQIQSSGGNETRMKNANVHIYIKY